MNFDRVAGVYDRLAMCVFGKEWEQIQLAPLDHVRSTDSVLIVGGGTGQILEHLQSKEVVFVEFSSKMIEKASKRNSLTTVQFVNEDFLLWKSDTQYDVVVMPFFLDCFNKSSLQEIIQKTKMHLSDNGMLQVIDFKKSSLFRNLLISIMHLFFKFFSGLEATQLLDFDCLLKTSGFEEIHTKTLMDDWIFSASYRLTSSNSKH